MVHKAKYQQLADAAAIARGGYASHIGKIGDETFVYSLVSGDSRDFDPDNQTVITVNGDVVEVCEGAAARAVLSETTRREFGNGRAIFKKYRVLVKNHSSVIGEGPSYAQAIVEALDTKAVKPSTLYQYLEIADHYHRKLRIAGGEIQLV